jgi:dipeptidyl aminopeptidase/acylaminoacyl peptidase
VGEADFHCAADQTERYYTALQAAGCPAETLRFPGASHGGAASDPAA